METQRDFAYTKDIAWRELHSHVLHSLSHAPYVEAGKILLKSQNSFCHACMEETVISLKLKK